MSAPSVSSVVKRLSQDGIARYADASGDDNPIHIDESFARTTPFGGTIAHGMLVLASISEMMTAAFGEAWLNAGKLKVRFRAPARPGETITASAQPRGDNTGDVFSYAIECRNEKDELLISGTAEVPSGG